MKTKVLVATLIGFSSASFAHQIANEMGHNSNWNWNKINHRHEIASVKSNVIASVKSNRVASVKSNRVASVKSNRVASVKSVVSNILIKGAKGLDAIANVGECYIPRYIDTVCKDEAKKILVANAYNETKVIPAVTKQVKARILLEPAKTIEEYVPALYENVGKKVLVENAKTIWKKGHFTSTTKQVNGETYCLVKIPARYRTEIEKVLKVPSRVETRKVKAVYKDYMKTVIVEPAKMVILKAHPAVYDSVEECVVKQAGHYEWRSILCEENASNDVLTSFERALAKNGVLSAEKVDGTIDDDTFEAIKVYQKNNNLTVDGLVNIETVKLLGVKY